MIMPTVPGTKQGNVSPAQGSLSPHDYLVPAAIRPWRLSLKSLLLSSFVFECLIAKCTNGYRVCFYLLAVIVVFKFFNRLYLEKLWVHRKIKQKAQRVLIYIPPPHKQTQPPHYQHSPPKWYICYINEPTLTHHHHSNSIIYISILSWCCTVYGSCWLFTPAIVLGKPIQIMWDKAGDASLFPNNLF